VEIYPVPKLIPMSTNLLRIFLLVFVFTSCIATSRNQRNLNEEVTTDNYTPDPELYYGSILTDSIATSLTDLPRTEDGSFVLSAGFYETEFKTYCLQPGTPDPSNRDAYYQSKYNGPRKDIIETILDNSSQRSSLDQRNVQLLLWSVVSKSDFNKLSPGARSVAYELLTPKQLFELNGGVLGAIKTASKMILVSDQQNDIIRVFESGIRSYEAIENLAVLRTPSNITRNDMVRDQWYRHKDGYFIRYLPESYKKTTVQVYVPDSLMNNYRRSIQDEHETVHHIADNYLVFDPSGLVIHSANSNAQRLGVGGPVKDVVKSVIKILEKNKRTPAPQYPKPPKPVKPSGPVS
jgi:hypothetical protein